jgi:hypothetical protein
MVNTKEAITMELTDKYLQEGLDRVYSADPTGEELVINDLKARMGILVKCIKELQEDNKKLLSSIESWKKEEDIWKEEFNRLKSEREEKCREAFLAGINLGKECFCGECDYCYQDHKKALNWGQWKSEHLK